MKTRTTAMFGIDLPIFAREQPQAPKTLPMPGLGLPR